MKYETEFITIYKIGYQIYDVPNEVYETICDETNEMIANNFKNCIPYNTELAGNISKEFQLIKSVPILDHYISAAAPFYFSSYYDDTWKKKFKIRSREDGRTDAWVNFQQKGEVNPVHSHGGLLSFVMYIKLPYTIEDEQNHASNYSSSYPASGCFQFMYVNQFIYGGIGTYRIHTDKNYEKKMIIFPAGLYHIVYPFLTSDEYRITIAGNIIIDE